MTTTNALKALDPIWFRFTDPEDIRRYGAEWFTYDESIVLRKRARDLIALETDLGMPLVAVMNGFRASTVLGDTAAAWLAVREADPEVAGDFDKFDPITMLIEWSSKSPVKVPKGGDLETTPPPPESSSPTSEPSPSTTSAPTDTAILQILPIVGS